MWVIIKSDGRRMAVETNHVVAVVDDEHGELAEPGSVLLLLADGTKPFTVDGTFEDVCVKLGFVGSFAP